MKNIGFIGCGNMGSAMLEGIMQAGVADGSHIYVANQHPEKLANLERRYGIIIANNWTTIDAVIYGLIDIANIENLEKAPPEIKSINSENPFVDIASFNDTKFTPGTVI